MMLSSLPLGVTQEDIDRQWCCQSCGDYFCDLDYNTCKEQVELAITDKLISDYEERKYYETYL